MKNTEQQLAELEAENAALCRRLQETEETLSAIRKGEVDALVVEGPAGPQIFSLQGVDQTYRVLVEEMQEGVMTLSEDGDILYANGFMEKILDAPLEKIIGATIDAFMEPPDVAAFRSLLSQIGQGNASIELPIKTGGGNQLPAYLSINRLSLNNSPFFCLAIKALQKNDSLFQLLAETIQDVFWMCTVGAGKMIYISPAYEKLWGKSTENLYQSPRSIREAVHHEDLDKLEEIINNYLKVGKKYECYYRISRKNDDIRWIHERGFPINRLYNGEQVMVGVCKDVTDQKLMEIALQKSQELYRTVVEDQTEIISRFKSDGTLTFVNETYCRFFGKSASDLIGKHWKPVVFEDDLPRIYRQLKKISVKNPVVVIENRVWDAAGRKRWMQFVTRGFFNEKGHLFELQSVGRDITDIKQKEKLLLISQKEIQEQAKDLQKVNTAMEVLLERRNRQIEELKDGIFRNFNKLILPDLNSLKDRLKIESNKKAVSLLIQNIENLLSSNMDHLTSERFGLSKTELKIATMIKSDMSSVEIAEHLNVSINTVGFHRKNLRKKLDIHKSKIGLSDYLKQQQ